jgi:hypothetical protein
MPIRVLCLLFLMISSAFAGDLKGSLKVTGGSSDKTGPVKTPPTAWEIADPMLRSKDAMATVSTIYKVVLIPEKAPKGKAKPGKIVFDKKGAKPSLVVVAPKSSVQFLSKESIALRINGPKPKDLTVSKKASMSFPDMGVYPFSAPKKPSISGMVLVGLGARIATVDPDNGFVFPKLTAGSWKVYLVSTKDVIEKGSIAVPADGDPEPLAIEATP